MSSEISSTLKIIALGRPFKLGMLYDCRTDELVSNTILWNSELIRNYTNNRFSPSRSCEIYTDDTLTMKADLLGMDSNLKMNALTGLVQLSRSAKLINSYKTTEHVQCYILKYSITTYRDELTITHLNKSNALHQELFNQKTATHVVTAILYGVEVYFLFHRALLDGKNHVKIDKSVLNLLQKMIRFQIFDNDQLNLDENEKKTARLLRCRYYGDFDLTSKPTTFEQAANLFKQLPKLLGEYEENTVPKQVWISPLYLLDESGLTKKIVRPSNRNLFDKSLELIERLHRLEILVNDLKTNLPSSVFFHQTRRQLSLSFTRINEFEIAMKRKIRKLLRKIHDGSKEEMKLIKLLDRIDLFSINRHKLENWIRFLTKEIKVLTDFYDDLTNQVNIHISEYSSFKVKNNLNNQSILCLIIHITGKNDLFLNEMFEYLNHKINKQNDRNTKIDYWFNREDFILIKNKIILFSEFARMNTTKQNVKFLADQQYIDEFQMNKDASFILYQNGTRTDFTIPSRPGQPLATDISRHSVTLTWSKPTYGSQSILRYKVYGQINTNTQWMLFGTTTDATESTIISNLDKGIYQFKIQGITLAGDTAESDISDIIDTKPAIRTIPVPKPIVTPPPNIIINPVTPAKIILDVTPAWFEPIKPVTPDKIRLPVQYDQTSPLDVRTYDCLSTFRLMTKESTKIDFIKEPFSPAVDNIETMIVVLNELATQLGARLTFAQKSFEYDDSDYRTACGVTNLGSIHSLLTSERSFQTAKFELHFNLPYDQITASSETLRNFILSSINDIATIAQCNKDFIRVFSVSRTESILVGFGITTPQLDETKQTAESLKQKLNHIPSGGHQGIFQHMFREEYDYKLESALAFLQLQKSDFEPSYNRAYSNAQTETRGGYPYYHPQGWFRHGLKVVDKYRGDQLWLGMKNAPGEWAVAYHGTNPGAVRSITDKGLLHSFVGADQMKVQAEQTNPSIPDVQGLYVATHCEGGASDYSHSFLAKGSDGVGKNYKVVFQCRVQPGKFTEHKTPVSVGKAWRVFDEKAIRPYGLLLKVQK